VLEASGMLIQNRIPLDSLQADLIFFVSYTYLFGVQEEGCRNNIIVGSKIAGLLSFLFAPVNFYYFGMRSPKE